MYVNISTKIAPKRALQGCSVKLRVGVSLGCYTNDLFMPRVAINGKSMLFCAALFVALIV